ncbi:thiamine pyrophosphate-binding protein [Rhizobium sp. CG5]|uniref:thiamine pyrophosphate-binding protein n=1 Tax=Rhizobium sp. CG5 TaxID=2726076 RepID=UPI002033780D|nr:thiamine pyrophosphate-binding protein [Rhizobium sp. CG5]MCM2477322.1 thiamine pyrophosphate-binding protein [Rhizobium sp. CG5]
MDFHSRRKIAHDLLDILADEGVTHIFGNPGSTELPLMDALVDRPDLTYVLGMQEATVVAMADGYALKTGRPAFVNLHTAGGLGNAMGALVASQTSRTPLVVTAGQQDTRHLSTDPWLSGDLVALAAPVSKWATEIRRAEDLGPALRRAFEIARTPPMGPVFLSLPMDIMNEASTGPVSPRLTSSRSSFAPDLLDVAGRLAAFAPDKIAIVLGDDIPEDAAQGILAVAHVGGYGVFGTQLASRAAYSSDDIFWHGMLRPDLSAARSILSSYEAVLLIGSRAFISYPYREDAPLNPGTLVIHIADNSVAIGSDVACDIAVVGDIGTSLIALAAALAPLIDNSIVRQRHQELDCTAAERKMRIRREIASDGILPLSADAATLAVLENLSPETIIVNESAATFGKVQELMKTAPGLYFFARGGVLGCAMPAAVGMALAGDGPVICFTGDGGAMYSPQALWSAAHHASNVIFVVFNNRRYNVLMDVAAAGGYKNATERRFVGMQLDDPAIDYTALAKALGVAAYRADSVEDISMIIREAQQASGPSLVEILIR